MAVPKRKPSKSRTHRRRAVNMLLKAPRLIECSNCGNLKLSHRVCPKCGFYKGIQVLEPEAMA